MHTLYDNLLLPILSKLTPRLLIDDKKGAQITDDVIKSMSVKTPSKSIKISKLSGGNQQKIVVGKGLISGARVMLMDDPMYGVDIHAKTEIAQAMERFTNQNNAVVFVSSELSEILENCDRILIIKHNEIAGEILNVADYTEDSLMAAIQ